MSHWRFIILMGILAAALVLAAGCTQQQSTAVKNQSQSVQTTAPSAVPPATSPISAGTTGTVSMDTWKHVRLETTRGNITIALDPDMPITAGNFESLIKKGYYDGVIFHRVINGFMIQGGDPTGTGRGGPGYTIQDEYTSHNKNSRGAVAMANTGQPNSGGSQFFINLADNSALQSNTFNSHYPVFGNVVEGMDVVDSIGKVQTSGYPYDRPLQNITIIRAVMV